MENRKRRSGRQTTNATNPKSETQLKEISTSFREEAVNWAEKAQNCLSNLRSIAELGLLDYMCHIQPAFDDLRSNWAGLNTRLLDIKFAVSGGSPQEMNVRYMALLQSLAIEIANLTEEEAKCLGERRTQSPELQGRGKQTKETQNHESAHEVGATSDEENKKQNNPEIRESLGESSSKPNPKEDPCPAKVPLQGQQTQGQSEESRLREWKRRQEKEKSRQERKRREWREREEVRREKERKHEEEMAEFGRQCSAELEAQRQRRLRKEAEAEERGKKEAPASQGVEGDDDSRWDAFVAKFGNHKGGTVKAADVPWPRSPFEPPALEALAVHKYFKTLLLRWHPDKFNVYGSSMEEGIMAQVTAVAQTIIPRWNVFTRRSR